MFQKKYSCTGCMILCYMGTWARSWWSNKIPASYYIHNSEAFNFILLKETFIRLLWRTCFYSVIGIQSPLPSSPKLVRQIFLILFSHIHFVLIMLICVVPSGYALCKPAFTHCIILFPNCHPQNDSPQIKICPKFKSVPFSHKESFLERFNMKSLIVVLVVFDISITISHITLHG